MNTAKRSFLIRGAHLLTICGEVLPNHSLLVADGLITEIAAEIAPSPDCSVIEAEGAWLVPGFIDPSTKLGLHEEWHGPLGADENETPLPLGHWLRVLDGIYSDDEGFQDALEGGVTTVMVCPGNASILGGKAAIIKTAGSRIIDNRLVREDAALVGSLFSASRNADTEAALSRPRRNRSEAVALLVSELQKAKAFRRRRDKKPDADPEIPNADFRLQALVDLLDRKLPLLLQTIYATDILNALELSEEWGFDCILERLSEGHLVTETLRQARQPFIIGPILTNRRYATRPMSHRLPAKLHREGLTFSLTTNHPAISIRNANIQAAVACREGLPEEEALKCLTLYPARLLGLEDRLGSLEVGKEADLALWSHHPFETEARVCKLWIGGELFLDREVS